MKPSPGLAIRSRRADRAFFATETCSPFCCQHGINRLRHLEPWPPTRFSAPCAFLPNPLCTGLTRSENMTEAVAKLVIGDKTYEFPVLSGTVGPDVIDIRSLYAKTGMFTYDPGFTSTAACDSSITYI